jgi:hypothetical protein
MLRSHCQLCGCRGALRHATLLYVLVPPIKAIKSPWTVYFTLDNMRDVLRSCQACGCVIVSSL